MKSLDKKKTKELDWKKELKLLAKQFPIFNADIKGLEQFIQSLLSQQRQEIVKILLSSGFLEELEINIDKILDIMKDDLFYKRPKSNCGKKAINKTSSVGLDEEFMELLEDLGVTFITTNGNRHRKNK